MYYNLLVKYEGDLSKAHTMELVQASKSNPNDPVTARRIAEQKYKEEFNKKE